MVVSMVRLEVEDIENSAPMAWRKVDLHRLEIPQRILK